MNNNHQVKIGVQGGKGSFSEQAARYYAQRNEIKSFKLEYLYTAEKVLRAVHKGDVKSGVLAIHNSTGGVVYETIEAMGRYNYNLVEEFAIIISHALIIRKDANFSDITTIMTHPQVLAQCKTNLKEKYPLLEQTSGEGQMIDHALVAKNMSEGKLPKNIATMGSKVLAELYDLKVVEDNLQDLSQNYTSFLVVER